MASEQMYVFHGRKRMSMDVDRVYRPRYFNPWKRILDGLVMMPSGCIEWDGGHYVNGYACIQYRTQGKRVLARLHRVMYTLFKGPIPNNLEIRHSCHNPGCVNINHLRLGNHTENIRDIYRRRGFKYGCR